MAEKSIVALCPKCSTAVEVKDGWFKTACPVCREKIAFSDVNGEVVACPECRKLISRQAVKENRCPACHGVIDPKQEESVIDCPYCTVAVKYMRGATQVTCPNSACGRTFNPTARLAELEGIHGNNAPDIRMNEDIPAEQLVWKFRGLSSKSGSLPLDARVHASSGMYALGRQGNTTKFVVDGQSVMLSETELRYDAASYDGGMAPEVILDIFYLRRSFHAQFKWGFAASVADQYGLRADYQMRGTVEIDHVTDPSLFFDAFCSQDPLAVRASDFAVVGMGDPGRHVEKLRSEINGCLQQAMASLRDARGCAVTEMAEYWPELRAEILRLANEGVAKYGVSLCALEGTIDFKGTREDVLLKRLGGAIAWQLRDPVLARRADDAKATVEMYISGSLRTEIVDEARLNASSEGRMWRDPSRDDGAARHEIAVQVAEMLRGRLEADINLLVFETKCDVETINSFQGSLRNRMEAELNQADGFFARRGLRAVDMTIGITLGSKSKVYSEYEALEEKKRLAKIGSEADDIDTQTRLHKNQNVIRAEDSDADVEVGRIANRSKLEQAEYARQQEQLRRVAAMNAERRAIEFDAWQDHQRLEDAKAEAAYARARRDQEEKQYGELARQEHEEKLFAVAQRIEESKLSWREKLDAYARLQRGVAFRDKMDERAAEAEAADREKHLALALRKEEMETLQRLKQEESLHEEELSKQRFAREMELRRLQMAGETEKLEAQYKLACLEAETAQKRRAAEDEIVVLRLMLEQLVKNGQQQVTLEALRTARAEAEQRRQEEKAEAERKAAQADAKDQNSADRAMATRAMELMTQIATAKAEAGQGGKSTEATALQMLLDRLNELRQALGLFTAPVAGPASPVGMNTWFNSILNQAGTAAAQAVASAASGGKGSIQCVGCGKPISADSFRCPHCGRNV